MKNTAKLKTILSESGEIRYHLTTKLWPQMNKTFKLFAEVFGITSKQAADLNQFYHYRNGGYPNENSPARYKVACDKVADMFISASHAGMSDTISKYLEKAHGIKIQLVKPKKLKYNTSSTKAGRFIKFTETERIFAEAESPEEAFIALMHFMNSLQTDICGKSDKIKYNNFNRASKEISNPDFKKSSFIKGVHAEAAQLKSKEKGFAKRKKLKGESDILQEFVNEVVNQ